VACSAAVPIYSVAQLALRIVVKLSSCHRCNERAAQFLDKLLFSTAACEVAPANVSSPSGLLELRRVKLADGHTRQKVNINDVRR
jgi:hypothetical protein